MFVRGSHPGFRLVVLFCLLIFNWCYFYVLYRIVSVFFCFFFGGVVGVALIVAVGGC